MHKAGRKKIISLIIILLMVLSTSALSFAQESDIANHWAKGELTYLNSKGVLEGYPDGTFKPNNNVLKSEVYAIVNRVIGYTETAEIDFSDLKESDWYYNEVAKGVRAGYITEKQGNSISANVPATRQEVAKIIGIAFGLPGDVSNSANYFLDGYEIDPLAKGYISILKDRGYISGFPDGTFGPNKLITRAEIAKMINNICGGIINSAGTISKEVEGNLLVNTADVILKDMTIKGDLYLTEGIGEGDVTLDNVVVEGEVHVRGGGENSIKIKDSTLGKITVSKVDGSIRVVIEGNINIPEIVLDNNVTLIVGQGATVGTVHAVGTANIQIQEGAKVENLQAIGKTDIQVEKGATVGAIEVKGKEVEIKSEGKIESVVATEKVKVNGQTIKEGTEIKVDNGKVEEVKEEPKKDSGSSGGSGGGGGGSDPGPDPEPVPVSGISVSPTTMNLEVGETGSITATVSPANAANKTVTWTSNDTSIATVSGGTVTAVGAGTATITAKAGGKTATCIVTVNEKVVEDADIVNVEAENGKVIVTLSESASIAKERFTVTQTVYNNEPQKVNILSLGVKKDVYTIIIPKLGADYLGQSIIITVSIDDKEPVAAESFIVEEDTGVPVSGISINEVGQDLKVGATLQLTITITPEDATNKDVVWSTSDSAIATVSGSGLVTAMSKGEATITATTVDGNKTDEITITVVEEVEEPSTISFLPNYSASLIANQNQLNFTVEGRLNGSIDTTKLKYMTSGSGEHYVYLSSGYTLVNFKTQLAEGEYYYLDSGDDTIVYIHLLDEDANKIKNLADFGNDSTTINENHDRLVAEYGWYLNAGIGAKAVNINNQIEVTNKSGYQIASKHNFDANGKEIGSSSLGLSDKSVGYTLVNSQTKNIVFYVGKYVPNVTPTSGKMKIVEVTPEVIQKGITLNEKNWIDVNESNFGPLEPEPEALTVEIDKITGDGNTLKGTFNKSVFIDDTALGSVNVSTEEDKLDFLNKLFNAPADLATYMNADAITINLTDTSVEVIVGDNAISKDLFEALDADGNGVWRMDVELNKENFKDAEGKIVTEDTEAFKIKFTVPFEDNTADYTADVKAVFQTQAQRDLDEDPVVEEAKALTVTIDEITGKSNTLSGTFNKEVYLLDGKDKIALGSVVVTEDADKLAFLNKLFNAPADLSEYMVADKVEIALTDTSVSVAINNGAIKEGLFKDLDQNRDGIWRMDVELNKANFVDADEQIIEAELEPFKIKFSSYNDKYSMGDLIDYSVAAKAIFQTQAQRDEEPYEKEVTLSVKSGATVNKSVVTMTTNTPIGTNLYPWSDNSILNAFTKDGAFLLVRLFKVENEKETPVFFNTVFDSVKIAPNGFSGLTYSSASGAGTRAGGDFSNLGNNSTQLFSDKGIKDSKLAGALIYNVKTTDIYSLWLPAGAIDLTLTNVLNENPTSGKYVIYFEAYAPGYKDASTNTKWSNSDELPLLNSVKVVEFTIE